MKYTDRKTTPLKWHTVVKYLICPVRTLTTIYAFLAMTNELIFNGKIGFFKPVFRPILFRYGVTLDNLGDLFWYVVGAYFITALLMAYFAYMTAGFFKWKESARKMWLVYLGLNAVSLTASVVSLFILFSDERISLLFNMLMGAYGDVRSATVMALLLAMVVMIYVLYIIIVILNFIYYGKRKPLFVEHYADESQEIEPIAPREEVVAEVVEEDTATAIEQVKPKPIFGSISLDDTVGDDHAVLPDFTQAIPMIRDEEETVEPQEEPAVAEEPKTVEETAVEPEPAEPEMVEPVEPIEENTVEEEPEPVEETAVEPEPVEPEPVEETVIESEPEIVEPKEETLKKYCSKCGAELVEGALFCSQCGTKIEE